MRQMWTGRGLRAALLAGVAGGLAACSSMPELNEFRLPDASVFLPSNSTTYTPAPSARILRPVGSEDLVDTQGSCSGTAASDGTQPGGTSGPVGLEMAECEVVRALGTPQKTELGATPRGERSVVLTFAGDRAGIYRFVGGRLVSLERAPDVAGPATAKKPPPKKPAKKQPAA